jgi:hypothetical protein
MISLIQMSMNVPESAALVVHCTVGDTASAENAGPSLDTWDTLGNNESFLAPGSGCVLYLIRTVGGDRMFMDKLMIY